MIEFSQGICGDGAAILKNGEPMTPEEIITALKSLDFLIDLKYIKDSGELTDFYVENKPLAWKEAKESLGLPE